MFRLFSTRLVAVSPLFTTLFHGLWDSVSLFSLLATLLEWASRTFIALLFVKFDRCLVSVRGIFSHICNEK